MECAMTDAELATPEVSAKDTIRTKGILHFTIGVRDHNAAAKWYSEILGCTHMRSTERYAFMECGGSYFVLAKSSHHVNPNDPGEDTHHHAFIVDKDEFERAMAIMKARGVTYVGYSDTGHITFPGRHAYFHDPDGNCIEIIDYVKK
jgi:catechol 2,3-dioxygenase-like lactoylglutathione lyase family enzyme